MMFGTDGSVGPTEHPVGRKRTPRSDCTYRTRFLNATTGTGAGGCWDLGTDRTMMRVSSKPVPTPFAPIQHLPSSRHYPSVSVYAPMP